MGAFERCIAAKNSQHSLSLLCGVTGWHSVVSYLTLILIVVVVADVILAALLVRQLRLSGLTHRLVRLRVSTRVLLGRLTARVRRGKEGDTVSSSNDGRATEVSDDGGRGAHSQGNAMIPELTEVVDAVRSADEFTRSLVAKRLGKGLTQSSAPDDDRVIPAATRGRDFSHSAEPIQRREGGRPPLGGLPRDG